MKTITKKVALWLLATSTILALSVSPVWAMWNWWWNGGWHDHNPSEMLVDIEKQDVSAIEIDLLQKQYEEEMMANELYTSFYDKYGIETFKNIAQSEAKHMQAVKALLDRYEIEVPTDYDHIKDLYEELKSDWSKSAFDALEVWVKIEFVDIEDIVKAIKTTDNDDIKIVFTNIGWGSYNHLRGFLKAIDNNWYETDLNWEEYLDEDDLNTKWPIKYKLAERLEWEWVELPNQVSSTEMKNQKCDDENTWSWVMKWKWQWQGMWKWQGKGMWNGKWQGMGQNNDKMQAKKAQYRKLLEKKYMRVFNALDNDKANKIIDKIDFLSEQTRASENNIEKRQNIIALLQALRDIISEKFVK